MSSLQKWVGTLYRKTEGLLRPVLYRREKAAVLQRFPALAPVMEAFEQHYIRVEYGAHDRSLMERMQRKITDQEAYIYGSTPWQTFLKIAASLEISAADVFIEPGCGTGHLCFLMNQAYGVKAIGIEAIANFIETAVQIREQLGVQGLKLDELQFENSDFFQADLRAGTIFFIAGTCFPEELRRRLLAKIAAEAAAGSTVITLTHVIDNPAFVFSHQVEGMFSWGRDKALIYRLETPQKKADDSPKKSLSAPSTAEHQPKQKNQKNRKQSSRKKPK